MAAKYCENCGSAHASSDCRFCGNCGYKNAGSQEVSELDSITPVKSWTRSTRKPRLAATFLLGAAIIFVLSSFEYSKIVQKVPENISPIQTSPGTTSDSPGLADVKMACNLLATYPRLESVNNDDRLRAVQYASRGAAANPELFDLAQDLNLAYFKGNGRWTSDRVSALNRISSTCNIIAYR